MLNFAKDLWIMNVSISSHQGLQRYLELYPDFEIADLYQCAEQRPRQGSLHCPALTTGCARMWLPRFGRFAHGSELLLMHGIPVTLEASTQMWCREIRVGECTHRIQCKLAGNSMHSACIGLMVMIALKCIAATSWCCSCRKTYRSVELMLPLRWFLQFVHWGLHCLHMLTSIPAWFQFWCRCSFDFERFESTWNSLATNFSAQNWTWRLLCRSGERNLLAYTNGCNWFWGHTCWAAMQCHNHVPNLSFDFYFQSIGLWLDLTDWTRMNSGAWTAEKPCF